MDQLKPTCVMPPDTRVLPVAIESHRERTAAGITGSKRDSSEIDRQPISGSSLLRKILAMSLILPEDWVEIDQTRREALQQCSQPAQLLDLMDADHLLTGYQISRLRAGKSAGLVLGNYRILERVGTGAMGVVYKAEHIRMRHLVAIKVLSCDADQDPLLLARFYAEMRAVARLHHPNIVAAIDAGETRGEQDEPTLHYFVMEYVEGQNLEENVRINGPMPPTRACQIIYQVAAALEEAHRQNLVHRDIKPSNILVTDQDQAKLLDFGLVMQFQSRMTVPGVILGTIDYMAPEQARDASTVDVRADIYSLGATFFWCLTGRTPFLPQESLTKDLIARMTRPSPSVRSVRPEIAAELDEVIACMMALDPANRYPTPQSVTRALLRFIERDTVVHYAQSSLRQATPGQACAPTATAGGAVSRVLVVDDEESVRDLCQIFLQDEGMECGTADSGESALKTLSERAFDLVLLDVNMPNMNGLELVRRLRANPPCANLKLVVFSGHMQPDEMAQMLNAGVDDFVGKPFSGVQLVARIKACLRHKEAEDRSDRLANLLLNVNAELEKNLMTRDSDLVHTRNTLVLAMARIVEQRHVETGGHLLRMQRYCQALAEEAAQQPQYASVIDKEFIDMLACCVPLHDIGMVAVPDHVLLKPDKLTDEERIMMQQHTNIGAIALQEVTHQQGSLAALMHMASDICQHHHERYDGAGYPNRLKGNAIPLCARLVAIADVYDALRSRRSHRRAMSHKSAMQIMGAMSEGHFDPALIPVFERCAPRFERIFQESGD